MSEGYSCEKKKNNAAKGEFLAFRLTEIIDSLVNYSVDTGYSAGMLTLRKSNLKLRAFIVWFGNAASGLKPLGFSKNRHVYVASLPVPCGQHDNYSDERFCIWMNLGTAENGTFSFMANLLVRCAPSIFSIYKYQHRGVLAWSLTQRRHCGTWRKR